MVRRSRRDGARAGREPAPLARGGTGSCRRRFGLVVAAGPADRWQENPSARELVCQGEDPARTEPIRDAADVAVPWADPGLDGVRATYTDESGGIYGFDTVAAPAALAAAERLRTRPEADQHDWIERYLVAGHACDPTGLTALLAELR